MWLVLLAFRLFSLTAALDFHLETSCVRSKIDTCISCVPQGEKIKKLIGSVEDAEADSFSAATSPELRGPLSPFGAGICVYM